jgi:hypothetical protein
MLDDQEEWPANKAEISTKIEEGYAAAQRGELIDGDRVRADMEEKKRLADRSDCAGQRLIGNRPAAPR